MDKERMSVEHHAVTVFVIAPRGADPDFARKLRVLLSVAESRGVVAFNADSGGYQVSSGETSIAILERSAFFIADLSFERPSCYFEVGFAQGLGKPGHLIARENTPIHQVLNRDRVRLYSDLSSYESLVAAILDEQLQGTRVDRPMRKDPDP